MSPHDTHTAQRQAWIRIVVRDRVLHDVLAGIGIGAVAGLLLVLFI
jgi:hypothetical protein